MSLLPEPLVAGQAAEADGSRKLMLVDGHALVHRAFHALPELTTTSGELVNAVFGWTSMVIKAIDTLHPTHAAVAFDCAVPTFRHDRYAGYKATRARTPPPLVGQFDRVRQVARAFHMPLIEQPGYEADDVLGTLAFQAEEAGVPTVIVTGDLDTLQLVDGLVTVLTSKRQLSETILYDVPGVYGRFGLSPRQIPDLKGLIGDTSDNIPGVRGIGEKTAAKLLSQYESIEGIYEHLDELPAKQNELLAPVREQVFESRELARIITSAPVQLDLDSAVLRDFDLPRLIALFRELEFRSLIPRLQQIRPEEQLGAMTNLSTGGAPEQQLSLFGQIETSEHVQSPEAAEEQTEDRLSPTRVTVVATRQDLESLVREVVEAGFCALVIEAEGGHMVDAQMVGITLATVEGEARYIPLGHRAGSQLDEDAVLTSLRSVLEDETIRKIGHDLKQVMILLDVRGIHLRGLETDTMLASYLENSSSRMLALDALAAQRLGIEIMTRDALLGTGKKQLALRDLDIPNLATFSGVAADVILRLAGLLRERLHHRKLLQLFEDVEMPLVSILAEMEANGVSLDCDLLRRMSDELGEALATIEDRIFARVGHRFNINSPPQLGEVLFGELKLRKSRRTKTGYSTDNEVLEKLRDADPIVEDILEFRQLIKLKSTYVDALPQLLSPRDGKIHTEFNQAIASTGRLSSSNPNLQNIPIRTEIGHKIRQAFVPTAPGSILLAADYSQIELRVLAHLSKDPRLVDAFLNNQDIHVVTAAAVWGIDPHQVTPDQRRIAKVVNFGIAYGIGEQRLAYETGLSREEAAAFIDSYRKTYAGVTDFMEGIRSQAQLYGQVSTLLHRVRSIPEIHSNHPGVRQAAERAAINMPVQGTAADIMKVAMIKVFQAMKDAQVESTMLLQVHDELVFEVPKMEIPVMAQLVEAAMGGAIELDVPLAVEVNVGPNWGEMRPYRPEA